MLRGTSIQRPARLLAAVAAVALAVLVPAGSAPADTAEKPATVRVSDNWELQPTETPIYGRDAVGMAVNPRNSRHIVAVYADWKSLWCETAVSFNGGRTWRRDRLKAPAGFIWPPCTVGGHLANQIDQSIVFGSGNRVYTAMATSRVGAQGIEHGRSVLFHTSTDGGRNFSTGREVLVGGPDEDVGPDYTFPKLAVARRSNGNDRIYLFAGSQEQTHQGRTDDEVVFTKSTNGGRTWSPRQIVDGNTSNIELSEPVIGRRGYLYIAWRERGPGQRPGRFIPEGTVVVAKSTDNGRNWSQKRVAGVRGFVYQGPNVAPFQQVQSFTASTFPRLAADRRSGNLYLVYGNGGRPTAPDRARKADHFIHPDIDVWFQRSTDDSQTWSSAVRINDEPAVPTEITQTRHPGVFVAPNGRVDIVWHDRRHWYRGCTHTHAPCLEARLGDTYYSYSNDRGRTFSEDRRINDRSHNNDVGYDYRFGTYWDYGPWAVHRGSNRLLVAWMDSRVGNFETDDQGIFLARVDHRPSRRIPRGDSIRARGVSRLAVELSQQAYPAGPEAVLGGTFATRPWTRVVIVNEDDQRSALAAGVLARANLATVLLSPSGGLPQHVKDEVARMQPIGAYIVGSGRALSGQVRTDLADAGVPADQIERIEGTSRADTARRIALEVDRRSVAERNEGKPAFDAAILVNPDTADAYTASVLAAARRLPILFVGRDSMPQATRDALATLDIARTLAVGGEDEISDAAVRGLPSTQRLGGSSTLNTSRAVLAESRRRALPTNNVYVATGRMDSALLGPAAGRIGGLQLKSRFFVADGVLRQLGMRYDVDRMVLVRSRG